MSAQAECSPECYLQSKTKIEPDLRLGNGLIGLSPTTEGDAAVGLYICKWVKCRFSWKKKKKKKTGLLLNNKTNVDSSLEQAKKSYPSIRLHVLQNFA